MRSDRSSERLSIPAAMSAVSIDRRNLLKFGAASALMAGLVGPVGVLDGTALAQSSGGRIRLATADVSPGDNLDPATQVSFTDCIRSYLAFEKLTDIGSDGRIVPQIAKAWSADPSAKVWTFELEPGVTFHDGRPLTPADVIYSFQRVADKKTASPGGVFLGAVTKIEADGADKVRFELSEANAEFPVLTSIRYMAIVPEGTTDFTKEINGSGPWKLSRFEPGISALYLRNEKYRIAGLPLVEEIDSFGIGDETARLSALLAGEADIIQALNAKAVPQVRASGHAGALIAEGGATATFPMRADRAPFDNIDVRRALKLAFDREEFIKLAFDGAAAPGYDHPIPPGDPFFATDIPLPKPDPEEVKRLLTKAGHADTVFELHTSDANYGGANAAVVLSQLMARNGVKVKVIRHPSDSYWTAVWMQVPWCASSWTVRPSAITRIEAGYITGAPQNEAFWTDPEVDRLVAQAKADLDDASRKAALVEVQKIIAANGGTIVGAFVPWIDGYAGTVKNLEPNPIVFAGAGHWTKVTVEPA